MFIAIDIFFIFDVQNNPGMRLSVIIAATLLLCSAASTQGQTIYENNYLVKVGDQAPDFTIRDTNDESSRLSDLRGSVVMLQFTASWCSVCRKEMPFIEEEIWLPGKKQGLVVIGVDRDEPVEIVRKFAADMKITYPLVLDPGAQIFGLFAEKEAGVTRNVIIDRNGKIIFLTRLFEREEFDKMKEVIFAELAKK
jgi:peroxiredoxin